jgi:hypothetical protein
VTDPAKLRDTVERFFSLLEGESAASDEENFAELADTLDELITLGRRADMPFEDGHPEPPTRGPEGYRQAREMAQKRFPGLDVYNVPDGISVQPGESHLISGDPYDDIADIAGDLYQVKWCLTNSSPNDALWHFRFSFDTHWGDHANNLRWYLHARAYGR